MRISLPLLLMLLVAAGRAPAQQTAPRPVTWTLAVTAAGPGAPSGVAELRATISPGWHLYSLTQPPGGARATQIAVVSDPPFRIAGRILRPAPDTIPDANFGIMSEVYDDSVTFQLPLAPRGSSGSGRSASELIVSVTYQVCSARVCLLPRTDSVTAPVPRPR